jgi:hypothetical protein
MDKLDGLVTTYLANRLLSAPHRDAGLPREPEAAKSAAFGEWLKVLREAQGANELLCRFYRLVEHGVSRWTTSRRNGLPPKTDRELA